MQLERLLFLSSLAVLAACSGGSDTPPSTAKAAEKSPVPAVAGTEHKAITTDKLEPYQCGTVQRLHTYGGVFLASQPTAADFEQAKQGGVKTVINLRHAKEQPDFDEEAAVTGIGLAYIHLPWNGAEELTDEIFDRSRELLNTAERPILLHCSSANRVGALWIPWRVLDGGLTFEDALAEAKVVGLKSPDFEAKAKAYVARRKSAKS